MGCSDVKATGALHYTENARSEQQEWRAKLEAIRLNEYCSPEMTASSEAVEEIIVCVTLGSDPSVTQCNIVDVHISEEAVKQLSFHAPVFIFLGGSVQERKRLLQAGASAVVDSWSIPHVDDLIANEQQILRYKYDEPIQTEMSIPLATLPIEETKTTEILKEIKPIHKPETKTSTPHGSRWSLFRKNNCGYISNGKFYSNDYVNISEIMDSVNGQCDGVVIPKDWGIKCVSDYRRNPETKMRAKTVPLIVVRGNNEHITAGADMVISKLNEKVIVDVTALAKKLRSLWTSVETDELTGLYTRKFMFSWADERIKRKAPFSVVYFDIDHFKSVNDTWGHEAGDTVLSCMGQFMTQQTREADVGCRYGGDEFVLFLPNISINQGYVLINRFREKWAERGILLNNGEVIHCTLSIGIAEWEDGLDC